jgi:hypothetical protein
VRYRLALTAFCIVWALLDTGASRASDDRQAQRPGVANAADTLGRRSYWLPGRRILALRVPQDWAESRQPLEADAPFTITFGPPTGGAFQVLVSVIRQSDQRPDVRAIVERSGRALLASAVEDRLVLEELSGPQVSGYFFKLTDRAPKPNEYKYLIQGVMRLADLLLTFTVLSNEPDAPEANAALKMLRAARVSPGMWELILGRRAPPPIRFPADRATVGVFPASRRRMTPDVFRAMNRKRDGKLSVPEFLNALFQGFEDGHPPGRIDHDGRDRRLRASGAPIGTRPRRHSPSVGTTNARSMPRRRQGDLPRPADCSRQSGRGNSHVINA